MRASFSLPVFLVLVGPLVSVATAAELPRSEGRPVVASVNGEAITLEDLEREIAMQHVSHGGEARAPRRQSPALLLERMINARLMSQEARRMGIEELPDARKAYGQYRLGITRDILSERVAATVTEPLPAKADALFKDAVREIRLRAILIPKEADAKALHERLQKGEDFDKLANQWVAEKKAQDGDPKVFYKLTQFQPEARQVAASLKPGQATNRVIPVSGGFTAFRVLEVRFPEDAKERAAAREAALQGARGDKVREYMGGLRRRFATIDRKLVAGLDYHKDGALVAYRKDQRAVAQIKGEAPVTVADLTVGMEARFFHGVEQAAEAKRMNSEIDAVLEDVLNRRVLLAEAKRINLDADPEFRARFERMKEGFLFGAFVQKAVAPDVKVEDADLKAFYKEHQSEFMSPEMIRIEALAFAARRDAEDALAKLQRGADFNWSKKTLKGQSDPKTNGVIEFPDGFLVASALPDGVVKALAGAKEGDYRFYGEGAGPFHVLHLRGRTPPKPAPFEDVRQSLEGRVYNEKITKATDEWAGKLRKASDVKVYAKGEELTTLVMRDMAAGS